MKKVIAVVFGVVLAFVLMGGFAFAQQDAKGCKDHPSLTRMEGFYIRECQKKDFDQHEFYDPATKQSIKVEGRMYYADYGRKKDTRETSQIQISRNYENAVKAIGGQAYSTTYNTYLKFAKDGKEIWADVRINLNGAWYNITIIEKEAMEQEVVADAKFMSDGISSTGHVAIYGIYFDFNKSDVKPESDPALKEITKLLQQDAKLKVYVVGHTDNVGGFDYNMKLSQQRAEAVVKELVSKHKVDGSRLKAIGFGPAAPVTSNKTEEGRAKNRRVELVEQ